MASGSDRWAITGAAIFAVLCAPICLGQLQAGAAVEARDVESVSESHALPSVEYAEQPAPLYGPVLFEQEQPLDPDGSAAAAPPAPVTDLDIPLDAEQSVQAIATASAEPAIQDLASGIPLGLPEEPVRLPPVGSVSEGDSGLLGWLGKVAIPLLGVVGLAYGCAWVFRRAARAQGGLIGAIGPGGRAPSGVLEVLGRYPVGRGQTLVLLKIDRRVLLLSQSAAGRGHGASFSTLAEISDPNEVASLLMKTRDDEGISMNATFRDALAGFSAERPETLVDLTRRKPDAVKQVAESDSASERPSGTDRALARIRARAASLGLDAPGRGAR
ncbi:MAG: flagellar biosynthetic protein FliO [Planctomycetota bacterium]